MEDFKSRAEQANTAGEQFCDLFFENIDKKRHTLTKMYTDSSTLIWNGNEVKGLSNIIEFFNNIPSTEHNVNSLDCQPVSEIVTPGHTTILIIVEGTVSYGGKRPQNFNQTFMITSIENRWKIASDCFRHVDR